MKDAKFLRIYLTESDRIDGIPAMQAVLELCRDLDLNGVTVIRGIEGMGLHGVHSSAFMALSSELPLIVEVIDEEKKIDAAVTRLRSRLGHRLLATWPVSVMRVDEGEP